MPNDNKLYLCFEYCDFDLKKYMKSLQYKLTANCIKVLQHVRGCENSECVQAMA